MRNKLPDRHNTNESSDYMSSTPGYENNSPILAAQSHPHTFNSTFKKKYQILGIFALILAIIFGFRSLHMDHNKDDLESVGDSDFNASTICTPPSTIIADENRQDQDNQCSHHSSSVPWPNFTYLIRASSSGRLLTLDSGGITLAKPGDNRGSSIHMSTQSFGNKPFPRLLVLLWKCIEVKGWLHFQNAASGCFLGHKFWGDLTCSSRVAEGWERFTVRPLPEGGYYLSLTHFERLWKVGIKDGVLAKIWEGETGGFVNNGEGEGQVVVWEFTKV
ncbi:hypothetical protein BPAE_0006g00180 [Botrytis paeoniae]|uniref:Uncharacterized protein n=1 Tax=Botrytis paeoniae TaxID=278948 RepID=A0A4Z1G3E0_9HELO|nr:hypothetical protein BPAE_0006g00180 [Botrytis paeoniae]